ncbi:MAG: fructose-1,6-bisphosphatase [Fastidiosipilaceae bacterium]|jgi:fructose-1,6-bisphosphatase-3
MVNKKYLRLLAKDYPNQQLATGEIIRLQSYNELPKGTEYFFSDLHGEDGAFIHLMRSASGNIRSKIRELYGNVLSEEGQNQLANLIYDPDKVMSILQNSGRFSIEWVRLTIIRLTDLCRYISAKYSRAEVAALMPAEYKDILDEMLYVGTGDFDRNTHINKIINSIVEIQSSVPFLRALCTIIQKICVNQLHIIGDIFDRGKGPHHIMEELIEFEKVDFQWGNHDIVWMGAAAGSEVCMLSVLRVGIQYNNFDALEDGYGINLRPLSNFAEDVYGDDDCKLFMPRVLDENVYDMIDINIAAKMHKAVAVLMFKLEGQLIERRPEYNMDDRNVLKKINFDNMTYVVDGVEYPMRDTNFPTMDPNDPLKLSEQEEDLMLAIVSSFQHSEPLHRHINFLYAKGYTYKRINNNLLFHGCIPMTEEGEFDGVTMEGNRFTGKALMDFVARKMTMAYFSTTNSEQKQAAVDFMWYLWCGAKSPMFGKSKMATFENYFVDNAALRKEIYNPYYKLSESEEICNRIFVEFDMDPKKSHIINGHVPVKIKDGESPVKANGKLFVIDGGISKAYQPRTGIAGYTLIFNSHDLSLAEHHSFDMIENDMASYTPNISIVEEMPHRLQVKDTDEGKEIMELIKDLKQLIEAYRTGVIKEFHSR